MPTDATNLLHADITREIIRCAMKVHTHFGSGFPEVVYKRSLIIEFNNCNLRYKSEVEKDIYYQDTFIGKRRLDLIVEVKY